MGDSRWAIRSEGGLVTAEFAVSLPAVIGLLVVSLTVVSGQVQAAQLQQLAAVASHSMARSETEHDLMVWLQRRAPNVSLTTSEVDGVLCATTRQSFKFVFAFDAIALAETSCAWVGRDVVDG